MPAHRSPSTTIHSESQRPYKIPVIVISSDEEDEPILVPKRTSRKHKHRRVKPEEILEISEEKPAKHEHLATESLQQRCHELEQVYAARFLQPGPVLIAYVSSLSKLLGTR